MNSDPPLGAPASRRRVPFLYRTQLTGRTPAPRGFLTDRRLEPEWLDFLPDSDSGAQQSRCDLRRLNRCMGHVRIARSILRSSSAQNPAAPVIELGAGDGSFLLTVARGLGPGWHGTQATLVDKQALVTNEIRHAFSALGWQIQPRTCDVFDWALEPDSASCPIILANLFLHHFMPEQLRLLLPAIARRSALFVAIEPRRSPLSLFFSKLVGLIGCNAVTRHDAPASVRAGFRRAELAAAWPQDPAWTTEERCAGPFSHLFVARRLQPSSATG